MTAERIESAATAPAKRVKTIDVTVCVAENYLPQMDVVVQQSTRVGLRVKGQLTTIGIIHGAIDPRKIPLLEQVDGVAAVEAEREYQLPAHGDDIQ